MKVHQQRYRCSALRHAIHRLANLTVWCKAVIGPKASVHRQLSNECIELVIQTQDAARRDVRRQHTTGNTKTLLMIANVSQNLDKITLNKLWDYCLLSVV
jgi:hypothetical protein